MVKIRNTSDFLQQYAEDVPDSAFTIPKKHKIKYRPEDLLQIACVKLIRAYQRTHPGTLQYIVAQQERSRTKWQQMFDKAMGRLGNAGHQEILLFHNDPLRDWFIELKAPDGIMSDAQLGWQTWAIATGRNQAVVRTAEEFGAILGRF